MSQLDAGRTGCCTWRVDRQACCLNEELAIGRPSLKRFYSGNGGKSWYGYIQMHGVTPKKKIIFVHYSCVRPAAVSAVGEN